ncbi:TonB family protein [Variovorax sp. RKNM96]|uniref:TonB family protein n=1 Tax=Variovorax sp. RKNM96 TaxID=2681552 RepID=UPI00197F3439|nr:TonB family protein [Variovorax sp. RKNM96]QSI28291.1 TonB family protein [Variovorax sp. RKNM96]
MPGKLLGMNRSLATPFKNTFQAQCAPKRGGCWLLAAALLLSGCTQLPIADSLPLQVKRINSTYKLTALHGSARQVVVTSDKPIFLPTFVTPDTVAYIELDGARADFSMKSLVGGAKQEGGAYNMAVQWACTAELQEARAGLLPGATSPWTDEFSSRPATGGCLAAFRQSLIQALHESGLRLLRDGRYAEANAAFTELAKSFPDSNRAASALFNAGVADFMRASYPSAADLFRRVPVASASLPLASEALLAAADCDAEMNDKAQLEADLSELIKRFPGTRDAALAQRRLNDARAPQGAQSFDARPYEPRIAILAPPLYPSMSKRLGESGRAVVSVVVQSDGTVRDATLLTSSGFERLDQAAIESSRRNLFFPARTREGKKVALRMNQPIRFKLE